MTSESLLLIGRETGNAHEVFETHAERLTRRTNVDDVSIATYESEPVRELRAQFEAISTDRTYVIPMRAAHTHDTIEDVPAALSYISGNVRYCEPLGRSPAVTEILRKRAVNLVPAGEDASLVIVGFGSSSKPYHRQTTEYHAARLRDGSDYGEVLTCYLLQNPAVECVRYNVSKRRAVAVPLFVTRSEATDERVPDALELGRGGIEYADPFGKHPRITDAIRAEVEKQRTLTVEEPSASVSFETQLTRTRRPVATDGEGFPQ
ncbi:sirohydrochlorin chelatase (plasmid) [Halococcus dombrowskii]|uniref:Sirohydrochlorin chelatase n=1 Tax=Halococcus dombrowskii TaxID=179637 RepID=A0AAV3SLA2_HALDO|nr:CbiX/SirB N-terminal domain-containing protein [Halococcus dombrowskii]UOO97408.1 sirohydrochlorin chelatase [Halococcus dombrowskii]